MSMSLLCSDFEFEKQPFIVKLKVLRKYSRKKTTFFLIQSSINHIIAGQNNCEKVILKHNFLWHCLIDLGKTLLCPSTGSISFHALKNYSCT